VMRREANRDLPGLCFDRSLGKASAKGFRKRCCQELMPSLGEPRSRKDNGRRERQSTPTCVPPTSGRRLFANPDQRVRIRESDGAPC